MNEVQKLQKSIEMRRLKAIDDGVLQLARRFQLAVDDPTVDPLDAQPLASSVASEIELYGLPEGADVASLLANLIHAVALMRASHQTKKSRRLSDQKKSRLHVLLNELSRWTNTLHEEEGERARLQHTPTPKILLRCTALVDGALPAGAEEPNGMLAQRIAAECGIALDRARHWLKENAEAKDLIARFSPVILRN